MRMVVTSPKASVYGKALRAGDEFECPEKEAKLWAALARAHPVSASGDEPIEVREIDVSDEIMIMASGEQAARKRRGRPPGSYNRRDMRADED